MHFFLLVEQFSYGRVNWNMRKLSTLQQTKRSFFFLYKDHAFFWDFDGLIKLDLCTKKKRFRYFCFKILFCCCSECYYWSLMIQWGSLHHFAVSTRQFCCYFIFQRSELHLSYLNNWSLLVNLTLSKKRLSPISVHQLVTADDPCFVKANLSVKQVCAGCIVGW